MKSYRKKPVVIEAIQWDGSGKSYADLCEFMGTKLTGNMNGETTIQELEILTLEGTMLALKGDYIIRGLKGECYPCKPDIFEASYDEV